jgi:gliding motility-associated-like protein
VNTVVTFTVTDACTQTATDEVIVTIVNPPVVIEVGEDINASCIDNTLLEVEITSGSGGYEYMWMVDGQVVSENPTYTIQSFETVNVSIVVQDACLMSANDMLTYFIPDIPLTIVAAEDTSICVHGSAHLWAQADGGEGGFTYIWPGQGVAGNNLYVNDPNATYAYTVVATDICGESISTDIIVELVPLTAGFVANEIEEDLYQFYAQPAPECDNCTYIWDFGDGSPLSYEENPQHKYDGLESYSTSLTVINEIGCSDEGDYLIVAPAGVYIPNSFTPNGDGINDYWQVVGRNILNYEVFIFNRWGEVVFNSTDPDIAWIGDKAGNNNTFVPNGVYNYFLKVKGYDSDAFEKRGTITLMR